VAQFGYLWNTLRRRGWTVRPQGGGLGDARVRRVWAQALPAAVGAGVVQINVCLDAALAFWAASWAPSALTYADRILYLPMGVVATAFGTVLLPTFSKQFAERDTEGLRGTLRSSLGDLIFVMMPAAVGLMALAPEIVGVLYERGEFGPQDTLRTARALACYAPGLVVFSVHKVLNPLFYAMHDTRTPMRVSAGAVLLNLVLNVTFVITWPTEWKHAGIAIATVVSSAVASVVLARLAARRMGSLGWGPVWAASKALGAAAVMALASRGAHGGLVRVLADGAEAPGAMDRVWALAGAIAAGAAVYAAGMAVLSPREFRRTGQGVLRAVRRRLGRSRNDQG
jgi:putative peptidoglycan lipid II flippase